MGSKQIHVSTAGSHHAAREGTLATGIVEGQSRSPDWKSPGGSQVCAGGLSGVCCASPAPWRGLCLLPGLSATAATSLGSWVRQTHVCVVNGHFLPVLCHSPHAWLLWVGCPAPSIHWPPRATPAPRRTLCGREPQAEVLLEAAWLQVFQAASEPFP